MGFLSLLAEPLRFLHPVCSFSCHFLPPTLTKLAMCIQDSKQNNILLLTMATAPKADKNNFIKPYEMVRVNCHAAVIAFTDQNHRVTQFNDISEFQGKRITYGDVYS